MTGGEMTAARIVRMIHPRQNTHRVVIVLQAALDASGTNPDQKIVAVAGFAAAEKEWVYWETQWLKLLDELRIERWHHTDFLASRGAYEGWKDEIRLYAQRQICRILSEARPFGVGAAVRRLDYDQLRATKKWKMPPDPYAFCIDYCLETLIHRLSEAPVDEGLAIFIDKDRVQYEKLGIRIVEWHERHLRTRPRESPLRPDPARKLSTTHAWRMQFRPLEAADILANETYRHMRDNERCLPSLGAIAVGEEDRSSPIVKGIRDNTYLVVRLLTKPILELELDHQARGDPGYTARERFIPAGRTGPDQSGASGG